ncbi:pulmonary surfactant-associated protein A-like isoform X1 [Hyla sarda]|uniref:pulmonary surfactant-associated protein A-like isoform X1 n=1 Tax=Hyla sarda TaxID=327740 RepID=UPI0024C44124|nr:pulmonary surfactant-associated protein A-like isoform X1 [Hyla sarda]XP_056386950.1 pulmonary surfactant-associated protein A-like isoform X1 [Hyla sarda]
MRLIQLFSFLLYGLVLNAHTATENGRCEEVTNTCAVISCSTHSPSGLPGRDGRDGKEGPKGEKGDRGAQGSRGIQGPPGKLGPPGVKGEKGSVGEKGEQGISATSEVDVVKEQLNVFQKELETFQASLTKYKKRPMGPPGGFPGPPGRDGLTGAPGAPGVQGNKGEKGDNGPPGIPALLDKELQLQLTYMNKRIRKLEGVLFLDGKIQHLEDKILATNGKEVDFKTSKATCENVGGSIARPLNAAENSAIVNILKQYNRYAYLGIIEGATPGDFHYLDGQHVNYTNWRRNEPSGKGKENCVEMYTDGTWNDKACNQYRLTVCEF